MVCQKIYRKINSQNDLKEFVLELIFRKMQPENRSKSTECEKN